MKTHKINLSIYRLSGLILLFATFSRSVWAQEVPNKQPNVLIIYTDDHRYTGVHALGDMELSTPQMDRLVADGVTFDKAFLMGAFTGATCVASRAMLLTGKNVFNLEGAGHHIPTGHLTLGEIFKTAGYNTYMVGKWHQDNASLVRSFEDGAAVMSRGIYLVDHFRMPLWDWDPKGIFPKKDAYLIRKSKEGTLYRSSLKGDEERGPVASEDFGPHTSEIFADEAVKYICGYRDQQPFLIYLAFHAPHDPRQAPREFVHQYPEENIKLPPSYMPQHPFDNGHMVLRDEELAPWPRTQERVRKELASYYAIISHLDAQIGKVVMSLKQSGKYDNTLIVLVGDSGLAVGNHGLMGKQNIYDEDGVHVPLVFAGGAIEEKGVRKEAYAYIHDILPTLCDLTGIQVPGGLDGKSLAPVIHGQQPQVRDYTYHAYRQFQRAYRKDDWKLIEYVRAEDQSKDTGSFQAGSRVTQLFDLSKDPWEVHNLAVFPEYFDKVETMRNEMREKALELGDDREHTEDKYDFWDYY
ncbi:sulfatase-like hydrolase/transferase [Echinicola sediminis]